MLAPKALHTSISLRDTASGYIKAFVRLDGVVGARLVPVPLLRGISGVFMWTECPEGDVFSCRLDEGPWAIPSTIQGMLGDILG